MREVLINCVIPDFESNNLIKSFFESKNLIKSFFANIAATYATNFAIVSRCYCGAREFVRVTRKSEPGDLINSAFGGFCSGALLGGQHGAVRYSIMFAIAGTAVDYAALKVRPLLKSYYDSLLNGDLKLPEWSPIQILDEEAQLKNRPVKKNYVLKEP